MTPMITASLTWPRNADAIAVTASSSNNEERSWPRHDPGQVTCRAPGPAGQVGKVGEEAVGAALHDGEQAILSAEVAVNYVRDVIDPHGGPVMVDLTALAVCDARGLAALVRVATYAEHQGCPFRLVSPSPALVKLLRITGLDRRFFGSRASTLGPPD